MEAFGGVVDLDAGRSLGVVVDLGEEIELGGLVDMVVGHAAGIFDDECEGGGDEQGLKVGPDQHNEGHNNAGEQIGDRRVNFFQKKHCDRWLWL